MEGSTYGVTRIYYRIDGRGWCEYARPFRIEGADGPRQVSFYAQNASGIAEPAKSVVLYKDDAAPNTRGGQAAPSVDVETGETVEEAPPAAAEEEAAREATEVQTDTGEPAEGTGSASEEENAGDGSETDAEVPIQEGEV